MLRLDLNKWLLGSGFCTALGVAAGFVYLYDSPAESMLVSQQWYQQPLLLFFSGMLLLALLLNVLAIFGVDFHRTPLFVVSRDKDDLSHFAQLAQQFLRQQAASPLTGETNYYLQREYGVLYYVQTSADMPLDIVQLRHIFQQMLRHQCHSALALVPDKMQSPAQIFALEANIRILDKQQLRNWIKS